MTDSEKNTGAGFRTLTEATRYLEGLINRERSTDYEYVRLDLRPVEALLDALGNPERALSVIHVAGSKGKGSTCLMAESILLALGERVGTFTSPHLVTWLERFRIDGAWVSEADLVSAVNRIRPTVDALREGPLETKPSFFDVTTAIAFLLFAEAGVDRAVIEVGLGGRLDSTNSVLPAMTCITSIELEHTDKLGETEAEIAAEKAGIIKDSTPLIVGRLRRDADRVVRARAAERAAPIQVAGEQFWVEADAESQDPMAFTYSTIEGLRWSGKLAVPGEIARWNAALAITCIRALEVYPDAELESAVQNGLSECILPGRMEVLAHDPAVLIDAAHTGESAKALARALPLLASDGVEFLLSVSADKELDLLLEALLPLARRVWITRAEPTRSLDPKRLAARIRELDAELPLDVIEDPVEASRKARAGLAPGRLLCATGSVYLAGKVRSALAAEEFGEAKRVSGPQGDGSGASAERES
ncbi:MAG: folylpolyglutamate synthase/dihydrofolate synthase family protein [Myxococcota bacterium]